MSTLKTHNLQSPDAGSVNIVMAPNAGMVVAGLSTYSNQINVGSNIKLGNAGVVTATSFVGSGANLTSLPSQLTLSNNADNRVITGGSGTNLNGESTLTYNGSTLIFADTSGDAYIQYGAHSTIANNFLLGAQGDGTFRLFNGTYASGTERLRIDSSGRVMIGTTTEGSSASDDLTIATSGTTGITIRSGTSNNGNIEFSDGTSGQDEYRGVVQYAHSDNSMRFYTDAVERARIDSNGQLLVGTTTSGTNVRAVFQGYNGGGENFQARVQFQTAQATNLSTNHHLANLLFTNASSSIGAEIRVQADEAWGTSDYPTRISFLTTPNGSATRSERLIIKNDGIVNIGVSSPQYAKKLNVQGGNDSQISVSNQDYTGHAADSMSGIEGRLQCGNSIWSSAGIRFKKFNGTIGDKHTYLELYATDGYSNKVGLVVQPDGEVTKPLQPSFAARLASNIDMTSYGANVIIFATEEFDVGSNYDNSNGRFTAPVAGKYYFGVQLYAGFDGAGVRVCHSHFQVNGTSVAQTDMFGGASNHGGTHYHPTAAGHMIRNLNQNDYVTFNMGGFSHTGGQAILYASTGNRFFGYLVG